jgi:hypothetical protein
MTTDQPKEISKEISKEIEDTEIMPSTTTISEVSSIALEGLSADFRDTLHDVNDTSDFLIPNSQDNPVSPEKGDN